MKLYFAYGANTNLAQMARRCPSARYVCNVTLRNHQLVFRGVADVVPARDKTVRGALWLITPACEQALDGFEGFPLLYVKRYVTVRIAGKRRRIMFYVMRNRRYEGLPSASYEECLRTGYGDCGMPEAQIDDAIQRAARSASKARRVSSWDKGAQPTKDDAAEEGAEVALTDWFEKQHSTEEQV